MTDGLRQQMYFWGKDVKHKQGNLLIAAGLERRTSLGLKGTSCYSMKWERGWIELHGACAGWYSEEGSFTYIRTHHRCLGWDGQQPPVPGVWEKDRLIPLPAHELYERALPFLNWWLTYETGVMRDHGRKYRERCHREFRKLPKSRPWLPPTEALEWLKQFHHAPAGLERARFFPKGNDAHLHLRNHP
jgi:hypothetical protein